MNDQTVTKNPSHIRSKNSLKLIIQGALIVCVLLAGTSVVRSAYRYYQHRDELAAVKEEYGQVQAEHADLLKEEAKLKDEAYLAQIARRDYYYSKDGEIIFNIDKKDSH